MVQPARTEFMIHGWRSNEGSVMQSRNLFANAQAPMMGERFEQLLSVDGLVIERIVSSPRIEQQRYVQTQDEWVVLLRGTALLEVDGAPLVGARLNLTTCAR